MNKIINKYLLTGDKFMPELHLKQPGFTYSACGTFTTHRESIVTRKEIVWVYGPFAQNFRNMSTIAGWSFIEGTDLFEEL